MKKAKTPTVTDRLTAIYCSDPVGQLASDLVMEGETEETIRKAMEDAHLIPSPLKVELINKVRDVISGFSYTHNRYSGVCPLQRVSPQ